MNMITLSRSCLHMRVNTTYTHSLSQKAWVTRGPGMHPYMPSLPPKVCRLASTRAYKQTVRYLASEAECDAGASNLQEVLLNLQTSTCVGFVCVCEHAWVCTKEKRRPENRQVHFYVLADRRRSRRASRMTSIHGRTERIESGLVCGCARPRACIRRVYV